MAGDELTPSESAILVVLMAEAREVLNTELRELYGLNVRKEQRDKLVRLRLVATRRSGRTTALQLDDRGWRRVQDDLPFDLRGAAALGAALTALQTSLRERVLPRTGCASFTELFSLTDLRGPAEPASALRDRLISTYDALADKPGAWVSLRRLRPFFADVPRAALDEELRQLSRDGAGQVVPESNQRTLTDEDVAAALRLGGQENHLLAIGA